MKIVLTHDVDSISKPFKHIWKRRKRFTMKDLVLSFLRIRNLYNNIEDIVSLEDSYGFKSTFFVPVFLFELNDEIIDIFKEVMKQGWEVQLHFVYEPIQFKGLFRMQKEFFEKTLGKVIGVRAHMLMFNNEILQVLEKENVVYDSSLRIESVENPNPHIIGKNILEIPIGVMDADIFGRLKLAESKALKYIFWKMKKAEKEKTKYFTILFHQESFKMKGGRIYKNILRTINDKNHITVKCTDVVKETHTKT